MKARQKKINYLYSEEWRLKEDICSEEEFKRSFNQKFFKTIMKMEKIHLGNSNPDKN